MIGRSLRALPPSPQPSPARGERAKFWVPPLCATEGVKPWVPSPLAGEGQAGHCSLHDLHFRHPWRSDEGSLLDRTGHQTAVALTLSLHTQPEVPLEAEIISPARLAGLQAKTVATSTVLHGNQTVELGEFFDIDGDTNGEIHVQGDLHRVKLIGAGMSAGKLTVDGDVGAHLGAGISGGEIHVHGSAGDWVAPDMSGGRVVIDGDAGHMIGSAYRGEACGITGGEIIIHGNARNEIGAGMRRGLIAVGGAAGDFAGVNMIAGTIIVLGELGIRTGAGMKRGSIVSMQGAELLPTFSYSCTYTPTFLRRYLLYLRSLGLPVTDHHIDGQYQRWCGDSIELNRGEILLLAGDRGSG